MEQTPLQSLSFFLTIRKESVDHFFNVGFLGSRAFVTIAAVMPL
jgi:hypothetical protein